ncbi:MAG TPA: ABC transporter ATP-binding protein [Gemmataceae bacterium]
MTDPVIDVRDLSRRFGATRALDRVTLAVPHGGVFGLVGPNGSGKTTLIKHVLGLLRAHAGSVRVFGRDPVRDPAGVLARVGCLTEDNDLPGWMRVDELMRYTRAFYPSWSDDYAEALRRTFALDPAARVGELSKGQKARAGLLVALAYRPELLVLDEPSSGLDPLARRDILAAVVRTVADDGRTVVFSSHLLDEVERVADHVAMLHRGRVVFDGPLDEVRATHRRVTVQFPDPRPRPPALVGALAWEGAGREWTAVCAGPPAGVRAAAEAAGGRVVEEHAVRLDEIFVARAGATAAAAVED